MIEKGKELTLGKLRTIQLIEANMQLLIRIFMSLRNKGQIEKDSRLSKCNYGFRKGYSIESTILEKRLIYDYRMISMQPMVHNLTNLQLCYDQ